MKLIKVFGCAVMIFSFVSLLQAQKFSNCKTENDRNIPKYKIGRLERGAEDNLLVFIGLKVKKIDEKGLVKLAAHLEQRFCKEEKASFWIFDDYLWAKWGPFDDTGIKSSIAGYSFNRTSGENSLDFRLEGHHGKTGYENTKLIFDKPRPKTP